MKTLISTLFSRKAPALLIAALALASTGQLGAQTAVSNLGQTFSGSSAFVGNNSSDDLDRVFSFTTGASASFNFSSVTFKFGNATGSPTGLTVGLYSGFDRTTSNSDGATGLIASLSLTSGNPLVAGNSVFSGSTSLLASTTYYIKLSKGAEPAGNMYLLPLASSHNEDGGGLAGWTIGNEHAYNMVNFQTGSLTQWGLDGSTAQFSIQASAIPEPSTYAAIAGAVMLGFAAWHRRRPLGK